MTRETALLDFDGEVKQQASFPEWSEHIQKLQSVGLGHMQRHLSFLDPTQRRTTASFATGRAGDVGGSQTGIHWFWIHIVQNLEWCKITLWNLYYISENKQVILTYWFTQSCCGTGIRKKLFSTAEVQYLCYSRTVSMCSAQLLKWSGLK